MSLSNEVPYFTGGIDSLDTPARPLSCTAFAPAHHSHTEQLEVKEGINKT